MSVQFDSKNWYPQKEYIDDVDGFWPEEKWVVFSELDGFSPPKGKGAHTTIFSFILIIVRTDEIDEPSIKYILYEKINQKIYQSQ
jgi:hypothetical protein